MCVAWAASPGQTASVQAFGDVNLYVIIDKTSLHKSLARQYPFLLELSVVVLTPKSLVTTSAGSATLESFKFADFASANPTTINHDHVNSQSCALGAVRRFTSKCLKTFQIRCFTINSFMGFIASLKVFLDEPPICGDSSTNLCTQDCRSRKAGTSSIEERLNRRSIAHQGHDPGPGRRAINS